MSSTDLLANLVRKNLTLICGKTDKKENLKIIKRSQPYDLIFVDASHEYKDVKKDLNNYSRMLSDSGILVVHDIHRKYFFVCGVGIAISKS